MTEAKPRTTWWGEYRFEADEVDRWRIGALTLWVQRASAEWKLAYSWQDDEDPEAWEHERETTFPEDGVDGERFAVQRTGGIVRLRVVAPDRSVVARPRSPLRVPSGHQARIFISSPLRVEVAVGSTPTVLRELPARRLSETWFGPSTREGQFAYALKTGGRTRLEDLPVRPYRFVTPVVIDNQAQDTVLVDRLNLPVPSLSIYAAQGTLWSEEVRMLRTETGDVAELDVPSGAPKEAPSAERLCKPREISEKGHLFRAFSSLLDF